MQANAVTSPRPAEVCWTDEQAAGTLISGLWRCDTRERHLAKSSPFIAESLGQLGDLSRREGDLPAALRDLERALALFVANPTHIHKGSLPETRFCLARVLRDLGKRERGIIEARQAASEYRALALTEGDSEYTDEIAEIDAWLAEPGATCSTKAKR